MTEFGDIFDFIHDLLGGFDFDSFLSLILSLLSGFFGGGGGGSTT